MNKDKQLLFSLTKKDFRIDTFRSGGKGLMNLEKLNLYKDEMVKPVVGYEDYYVVSNYGRVFSFHRKNIKELKYGYHYSGHGHVNLSNKKDKPKSKKVHQIVIEAFVGECPKGYEIRHLNGIPNDNRLINLQYGTKKENAQDRISHGTINRGSRNGQSKLTESNVLEIRNKYKTGNYTHKQLAQEYEVGRRHIGDIINRVNWDWLKEN